MREFFETIRAAFNIKDVDVRTYSPLSLAYLGDAVYDVIIKYYLVTKANKAVNKYHTEAKAYVKASNQAATLDTMMEKLTEEELRIVKWGRNAKSGNLPKHATKADYQKATALECLLGYWVLIEEYDRLLEFTIEGMKNNDKNK